MFKRDPFVRFISIHNMSTAIWPDYEALVDSKTQTFKKGLFD